MNLLITSGFLGSGKTSLLLIIAKHLAATGNKIAIIENEIGKAGVDNTFLKENNFTLKEIFSGCICCSLRSDLITSLLEIEKEYNPDIVILEPSGIAGPKKVIQALEGYGGEINSKTVLSIIDAERFQKVQDMSIPLISDGINVSDIVVINKIDLANDEEYSNLENKIMNINPEADIIGVSALESTNMDRLLKKLDKFIDGQDGQDGHENHHQHDHEHHHHDHDHDELVIVSLDREYDCADISEKDMVERLHNFARRLKSWGARLIGNLKVIVKTDSGGYLLISTTSFKESPHLKGRLPKSFSKISLTLNAIVYGVSEEILKAEANDFINFNGE